MTNKSTFAVLGIFAVLLMSLGMVSAVRLNGIAEISSPTSVSHDDGSFKIVFNLTNDGVAGTIYDLSNFTSFQAGLTSSFNDTSMANGSGTAVTEIITATITFNEYQSGTIIGNINIGNDASATDETFAFSTIITPVSELTITSVESLTKTTNGTVKVQNTGNVNLEDISLEATGSDDFDVQFNDSDFNLIAGQSVLIKVSSTDVDDLSFKDDNSLNVKATNGTLNSNTITLTVDNYFYDGANKGELEVSIDRINVEKGYGEDEEYWYPFDDIELKITIDNNGEWDVENIELQLCLLDVSENKCILDEDDMEISEDDFDIDSEDDNSVLVNFNVDPSDLREGNTDYTLYVSAVGEVDDSDSDYDGDDTGDSDLQEDIEIRTNEDFIIFDQVIITDSSGYDNDGETSCGNEITLSANVWNIGDRDMDDDEIFVLVYNRELGINEVISFNDGINSMDWELLETTLTIPSDTDEKSYFIKLTAYDDEDLDDNDIYENKEDEQSEFYQALKITNCGASSITQPTIRATLESEAKVGEELVVSTIVTNNDDTNDFIFSLSEFEDWATLVSITPQTASIDKGEFAEVSIVLKPTVVGSHSFNINAIVNGNSYDQPVSVNIAEKKLSANIFGEIGNTALYIITGVVTLLIVIVLVLIVKTSKRQTRPEF